MTAPVLGSETQIELSVLHAGKQLIVCRVMDDLSAAFLETPVWQPLIASPGIPTKLRYTFVPRERGDHVTGALYLRYRTAIGLVERWAMSPLYQTVRVYAAVHPMEEQSLFLAR